jgi:hypothetical protein
MKTEIITGYCQKINKTCSVVSYYEEVNFKNDVNMHYKFINSKNKDTGCSCYRDKELTTLINCDRFKECEIDKIARAKQS